MLDPRIVTETPDVVRRMLADRNSTVSIDPLLEAHARRRALIPEIEDLQRQRNDKSKRVGQLMRDQQRDEAEALKAEVRAIGDRIPQLTAELEAVEADVQQRMLELPNLLEDSVPRGPDASANREERRWGEPRAFAFQAKDHVDLGEALGIIDFERGVKLAGARFTVLRGAGARLSRALAQFMLDLHTRENGYVEVQPPYLCNRESFLGTGQLPKFEADLFRLNQPDNLYLVPTAEVPVTNLHRDEILEAEQLDLSYCAFTPCFRAEAGSHGRDVRGMLRQHQFDKVELVKITKPETSAQALEALTGHAEKVLQRLELPYRVMSLCSGDLGFGSARTYDLEVWLPGQQTYREISSCSNYLDFQARRMALRYRSEAGKKPRLCHTLNGSGVAIGRCMIALLENGQQADGSVRLPEALGPYLGGELLLRAG